MKHELLPEWYPQQCILLTWPHKHSDWLTTINAIYEIYITLATQLALTQKVIIIAYNQAHADEIKKELQRAKANIQHIDFICIPTNDTWVRDYGPISCMTDNQINLLNFNFNGYGNKYSHELDNRVNASLSNKNIFNNVTDIDLVLEGGSIETDGKGTLLTTTTCLLSHARNKLSKQEMEIKLKEYFGVDQIIWLDNCHLTGDDTDGHIDNFVRFINPKTILYLSSDNKDDPHFDSLQALKKELTMQLGTKYNLIPIPLPDPILQNNQPCPASYLNFLITNHSILVPTFNDRQDNDILGTIAEHCVTKTIIPIDSQMLVFEGGAVHCSTMQIAENNKLL